MIHSAALVNGPWGDPGVFVDCQYRRRAFLFDLGDLRTLAARQLLKIDYVFVSHTHMDHFIGFDHLLRVSLGRDRRIWLFGPPGVLEGVERKLGAYTWNLVANYTNAFEWVVTEVRPDHCLRRLYRCRNAFRPEGEERLPFTGCLAEGDLFRVRAVFLDHGIPCLAFSLEEKTRLNIKQNILREMGLPIGAWLQDLKGQILAGAPDDFPLRIWWRDRERGIRERHLPLGLLRQKAVKVTPGRKCVYVTDVCYHEANANRIVALAEGAEWLFIETPFADADAVAAARKCHLTTGQAGQLARRARVKRLVTFHYSPKYTGQGEWLSGEAMAAFRGEATVPEPLPRAAPGGKQG